MNELKEKLLTGNLKTSKFTLENNVYLAKCVKCYDADSIHIVINFGDKLSRFICRLYGIDTAELRSKNPDEKKYARESRDYLKTIILDKLIIVKCGEFDKYGRLLVDVYPFDDNLNIVDLLENGGSDLKQESSINNHLIEKKYAYKYLGGTKVDFKEWSQK